MKKLAIVTGANRGIGEAIAASLAKKGLEVIGTERKMLDVGDDASIDRFVASLDRSRGVDVLVNNAGVAMSGFHRRVLQLAQLLIKIGDSIQRRQHLRLQQGAGGHAQHPGQHRRFKLRAPL